MKKESGTAARELFRKNLNRYMELRGITQADIVTRLGVSSAKASDWVSGSKYPRVDAIHSGGVVFTDTVSICYQLCY